MTTTRQRIGMTIAILASILWLASLANAQPKAINVNTATVTVLETLPGIGPVLAKRIIEGRPYAAVDDLAKVKGIKAKKLATLRPLVVVK